MPLDVEIADLETRLGGTLPNVYRMLANTEAGFLKQRGFDPKTLLVLNLELRYWDHIESEGKFFLNGDGCGNYYFTQLVALADGIALWSHDPPGIEDTSYRLPDYFHESEQECRVDWPPRPGRLYICRSEAFGESMLEPIGLEEWVAAVDATRNIKHVGYREGRNPFNGETIRVESPGLAAIAGSHRPHVSFLYGRAEMEDNPAHSTIAAELARLLHARLLSTPA